MKKQILLPVFAALVATGPLHASALLNAAGRLVTTIGLGGAGLLYAAENHPHSFDRVSHLVSGLASRPTPQARVIPAPAVDNTLVLGLEKIQAQMQGMQGNMQGLQHQIHNIPVPHTGPQGQSSGAQIVVNLASNPITWILIAAAYHKFGSRYTQWLVKKLSVATSTALAAIWNRLTATEEKVDKANDQLHELAHQVGKNATEVQHQIALLKQALELFKEEQKLYGSANLEFQQAILRLTIETDDHKKEQLVKELLDKYPKMKQALETLEQQEKQKQSSLARQHKDALALLAQQKHRQQAETQAQRAQEARKRQAEQQALNDVAEFSSQLAHDAAPEEEQEKSSWFSMATVNKVARWFGL